MRSALTSDEKKFLGIMANNIIQHFEMTRDKKDRQRAVKMNECSSIYIDPLHQEKGPRHGRRYSNQSDSTETASDTESRSTTDGSERIDLITRAADLLREAMALEKEGGGVVFLDTAATIQPDQPPLGADNNVKHAMGQEMHGDGQQRSRSGTNGIDDGIATALNNRSSNRELRRPHTGTTEILAHSYESPVEPSGGEGFTPFSPEELSKLIKRYPRGKLLTFDKNGLEVSDSSSDEAAPAGSTRSRKSHKMTRPKTEVVRLQKHFPRARQIIFLPLWDSTTSRSNVCFVYNCSHYRNFAHHLEFLHCISFTNSVDTELMRLANEKAAEQKSDFIGSVSHELRSPLHGILASCEFLQDTECTSFQRSLVNTANGCARTLLDTLNMVLDYSNINAFEKQNSKTSGSSQNRGTTDHAEVLQTSLSAYRHIDLAMLTEEVVEGVATGHAFDSSLTRAGMHDHVDVNLSGGMSGQQPSPALRKSDVELIVDIPEGNWTYWSEAGALRRIVMNLVSNSLKYTQAGFIHVELATQETESSLWSSVVLTVTDSGQGISPAYLKNKLFTPFAQESNLAPGTGLGLSLVNSIIHTLGGQIDVKSTVGFGTKVTVKIPMTRGSRSDSGVKIAEESLSESIVGSTSNDISSIKSRARGKTVALYLPNRVDSPSDQQEASHLMRKSLTEYLSTWYDLSVSQSHTDSTVDLIITEEAALDILIRNSPQLFYPNCRIMVLVLCNTGSMLGLRSELADCSNIEEVCYPIGPYKLARALQTCLERLSLMKESQPRGVEGDNQNPSGYEPQLRIEGIAIAAEQLSLTEKEGMLDKPSVVGADGPSPVEEDVNTQAAAHGAVPVQPANKANVATNNVSGSSFVVSQAAQLTPSSATPSDCTLYQQTVSFEVSVKTPVPVQINSISETTARVPRILCVDDNTINLRLLQMGVKKRGYSVVSSADNGLKAVNTYRDLLYATPPSPPNIILMDLSMPVMNGFEATRQIRKIEAEYNSQIPPAESPRQALIIALTGLASIRDQKEAYTAGVDSYIMKPVSFAKLTTLLEEWTLDGKVAVSQGMPETAVVAG